MTHNYVAGTMIPEHFLPGLGYLAVRHSELDQKVSQTIWYLSGIDGNTGAAITSAITSISTKLVILCQLVTVKVKDKNPNDARKLLALASRTQKVSATRNRLMHDNPYYYSPSDDEVGFFKAKNLTHPQIQISPPTRMTLDSLKTLGDEMFNLSMWFGMYQPRFPDCKHPDWLDDAKFPWPDK